VRTRKKPKKASRRFRFFFFLFLLFCLAIGGYYFLSLPIWQIRNVSVTGTKMLSAEEIAGLSSVPIGENLFLTNFGRARDNLRKIAAIKEFHLYRIPPATVLINVTERAPIAIILIQGKSAIVDEAGYILNRNPNLTLNVPNMTDFPAISGLGSAEVMGGEKINPKVSRIISDIILQLSGLLGSRRIQLELGGFERISFVLDDILRVKIGRDEDLRQKMAVFAALLPVLSGKWAQVEYVDVRYPNNPVIKYK